LRLDAKHNNLPGVRELKNPFELKLVQETYFMGMGMGRKVHIFRVEAVDISCFPPIIAASIMMSLSTPPLRGRMKFLHQLSQA